MSTFAVISDIHGNYKNLEIAFRLSKDQGAEYFLILGDLLNHGPRNGVPEEYDPLKVAALINQHKEKTIIIRGNCDSEVDQMLIDLPISNISNTLFINGHKCFMTHGHKYKAEDANKLGLVDGDFFMSGHTHVTVLKDNEQGVHILNPGSITFPKKTEKKTFAIITDSEITIRDLDNNVVEILKIQ